MTSVSISIVFTDLVDSTALASRVGASRADELRVAHFTALREALVAHDGTEVKNLGDGLMVAFPSLGRALDCAILMQQRIRLVAEREREELEIRVGVSTGDAVAENGDYFGMPVVEAARLCAKAGTGKILVPDVVRVLARGSHQFRSVGSLELKGIPEAVEAYELKWVAVAPTNPVPAPRRLAATSGTALCGRTAELEEMRTAFKAAVSGERRIMLVSAEAGMGKTRLAIEAAREASALGATVLYGRCDEELGTPYQPFAAALEHYVAHAPQPVLDEHVARHGGDVLRLAPSLLNRAPGAATTQTGDAESERYLLLNAAIGLLGIASTDAPILLVLDDLHWADKPTLLLLKHIARATDEMRVLIIGTYRDTDLDVDHPLTDVLAELRSEAGVERLTLNGLDDVGTLELLTAMAGHELEEDGIALAHAIRRETAGNPFFTGELIRHLVETGAVQQDEDGRWSSRLDIGGIALPESVREVVSRRIRRLDDATQRILSSAAVIGREFDITTVAAVVEVADEVALDALDEAARASIVVEVSGAVGRYAFVHALIQHSLYDELSAARRARVHRRIGQTLEEQLGDEPGDRIGELARHWVAATDAVDVERAITYARQAAQHALATLAPDAALNWLNSAIELHTPVGDVTHAELLVLRGEAQRQAGDPGYRETLLQAASIADTLGDRALLVRAALANQRGILSTFGLVDDDRVRTLERALEVVGDGPTGDRATVLALLASELVFAHDHERCLALSDEARALADDLDDPIVTVRVRNLTFLPCWLPERMSEATRSSARAVEVARSLGDPIALTWAAIFRYLAATTVGDREAADDAFALATSIAGETGQPAIAWFTNFMMAQRELTAGNGDLAERLTEDAWRVGEEGGQLDAIVVYGSQMASVRWHQGRIDELEPLLTDVVRDHPGLPGFAGAHSLALRDAGKLDELRAVIDRLKANSYYDDFYDYTWTSIMATFADSVYRLEDREAAAGLYERIAGHGEVGVSTIATFLGVLAHYAGLLAIILDRLDDADAHFAVADRHHRAWDAPYLIGRNNVGWARMLVLRAADDDVDRARVLLAEACALAAAAGCTRVELEASERLAALTAPS